MRLAHVIAPIIPKLNNTYLIDQFANGRAEQSTLLFRVIIQVMYRAHTDCMDRKLTIRIDRCYLVGNEDNRQQEFDILALQRVIRNISIFTSHDYEVLLHSPIVHNAEVHDSALFESILS